MARATLEEQKAADRISHELSDAKLIGYDSMGHICVWSGGYTFCVFDAAGDWEEIRTFTTGDLVGVESSNMEELKKDIARQRMQMDGFDPVE